MKRSRLLYKCPRCKQYVLDLDNCGESGIYQSRHVICVPCFDAEEAEFEAAGTNNLPETLASYGPPNAHLVEPEEWA